MFKDKEGVATIKTKLISPKGQLLQPIKTKMVRTSIRSKKGQTRYLKSVDKNNLVIHNKQ